MHFVSAILIAISITHCYGATLKEQLEHIATKRLENLGYQDESPGFRRFLSFSPGESSVILGAPSMPSHLPEAEPILPGHTLIRPALGMLKSSVKFPHKDWENGAGVYGNINSLGITYGGTNERVLYTGFRRSGNDIDLPSSEPQPLIILMLPHSEENEGSIANSLLAREGKKIRRRRKKKKSQKERKKHKEEDFKKKRKKSKKHRFKKLHDGTGYKYNRHALNHQIFHLKGLDLPSFGYDGLSKKRVLRRHEQTSAEEHNEDSTDVEIHETNQQTSNNTPDPKMTWFLASQDLYNHIKISQDAPDLTELMPVVPKDYDEKEWATFPILG